MTSIDLPAAPGPVTRKRSKGAGPWRRRAWAGRLFVAPNLAAVAVFMLFPLGFSLYMSFQQWDVFRPPKFVGLKNFEDLFTSDPLFLCTSEASRCVPKCPVLRSIVRNMLYLPCPSHAGTVIE